MINFAKFHPKSIIGRLLRLPFKFIPPNTVLPILQGRLRGKKWIICAWSHGYWTCTYEWKQQKIFIKIITPGTVVYDIGAHAGFYTLLASELVGPQGKVIAFEPSPRNLYYLREHLRLNHCSNTTVIEAAVAEDNGVTSFDGSINYMAHISKEGSLKVKKVCLDDLVLKGKILPPDYIKIDVEGAEWLVLSGARVILDKYHPTIFLSTHSRDLNQQCCNFLVSNGYVLQLIRNIGEETCEILAFKQGTKDLSLNSGNFQSDL